MKAIIHKDGHCIVDQNDKFIKYKDFDFLFKTINDIKICIGCKIYRNALSVSILIFEKDILVFNMETIKSTWNLSFPSKIPIVEQKIKNDVIRTFYKNHQFTMSKNDYDLMRLNCVFSNH